MGTRAHNRWLGTCPATGKRRYTSKANAKKAGRTIKGRGLSAYHCSECDMWHLGHRAGLTREQHRTHHDNGGT